MENILVAVLVFRSGRFQDKKGRAIFGRRGNRPHPTSSDVGLTYELQGLVHFTGQAVYLLLLLTLPGLNKNGIDIAGLRDGLLGVLNQVPVLAIAFVLQTNYAMHDVHILLLEGG